MKNFLLSAVVAFLISFVAPVAATAGVLTSLDWASGSQPEVRLGVQGTPKYEVQVLEHGLRLRLHLKATSIGPKVAGLGQQGIVKGVFPYLADAGQGVNIDFLTRRPAALHVQPVAGGLRVGVVATAAATAASASAPATAAGNYLEGMTYSTLPGNKIQLRLQMSAAPVPPAVFRLDNPPSVVLDFPKTRLHLAQPHLQVGVGSVVSATAVEANGLTRVVLDLVHNVPYKTFIGHRSVTLLFSDEVTRIASAAPQQTLQFASAARPGHHRLMNIGFQRGPEGDGQVKVQLSDPNVGINITRRRGQIIVDFLHAHLPQSLQRQLNVADFATPVQAIDTFARGHDVRMIIKPSGEYQQLAYQAGRTFTVDVKPPSAEAVAARGRKYTGKRISMNFENISVRSALQVLADFTHLNFVTSDAVTGSLTLRLENVPWDQALHIILDAKGLAMRRVGNVVMVGPQQQMAAQEKARLLAAQEAAKLEPLESVLIRVNYAKASDIAALLKSIKPVNALPNHVMPFSTVNYGSKSATESNSLLSSRGQVTVDERTNSLLIQDVPEKIRQVRKLIAQLDQPVQQVLIEARLVEATDDFSKSLGVRFGSTQQTTTGSTTTTQVPNLGGITTSSGTDSYNVDLPSTGNGAIPPGTIGLTLAKLGTANLLNLELSALQTEGKGKIISSPRVITANQKEAVIEQGQEQFFNLGFGQSQVKKAVLGLDVTPQVTPDRRVILTVNITDDTFTDAVAGTLNTKKITTQVLLDNGQTVVIGGIYTRNHLNTVDKVPFFGDLPLLGWLFRNHATSDQRDELLIFLTPKILSASLALH